MANLITVFGRLGVPLFVMLTGFLMLGRDYENEGYLKKYLKRNFWPLVVAFECWNWLWYLLAKSPWLRYGSFIPRLDTTIKASFFASPTNSALWYLQMIIPIYLGLPILATLIKKVKVPEYVNLLLGLVLLSGTVIPTVNYLLAALKLPEIVVPMIGMNLFSPKLWGNSVWTLYLLCGYGVKKGFFKKLPFWTLLLGMLSAFLAAWGLLNQGKDFVSYDSALIVLAAVSLFELVYRLEAKLAKAPKLLNRLANCLSRYSFAAYMQHLTVAGITSGFFYKILRINLLNSGLGLAKQFLCYLVFVILNFAGTFLITFILKKIPPVKKWLYLMK